MTDPTESEPHPTPRRPRRPSLDDVFGEVLPDVTDDERSPGSASTTDRTGDSWYEENRPPHHDSR